MFRKKGGYGFVGMTLVIFGLAGIFLGNQVLAEVKPGDLINQTNVDKVKGLVPDHLIMQIENYGLVLEIGEYKPFVYYKELQEATAKYSPGLDVDPDTYEIAGGNKKFIAGIPFPNPTEPRRGLKVLWNVSSCAGFHESIGMPDDLHATMAFVDGKKGIEKYYRYVWARLFLARRAYLKPAPMAPGNKDTLFRYMLFITHPFDIAGLGNLIVRSIDTGYDQTWMYVPVLRRVRRASAEAHMDAAFAGDAIWDDIGWFDGRVEWLLPGGGAKVIEEKEMLGVIHAPTIGYDGQATKDLLSKKGLIDVKNPPYWNPIGVPWEKRPTVVLEVTFPEDYPYSKKMLYVDTEHWGVHYGEAYDRAGRFWKWFHSSRSVYAMPTTKVSESTDGPGEMNGIHWNFYDFQAEHATLGWTPGVDIGIPMKSEQFSVEVLRTAGR